VPLAYAWRMSEPPLSNPYAPPQTEVADVALPALVRRTPFFAVGTTKLLVMCLCTMTLYQLFWFYKNWRAWKLHSGENVTPVLRTLFAVLFCYPLFKRINERAEAAAVGGFAAGVLATVWIVLSVLYRLPDPYWLVSFGAVFVLPAVQAVANRVNETVAPGHDRNRAFSAWNWVAVALGGPLMVLAIIGAFTNPA
jgi:hypothetical protein